LPPAAALLRFLPLVCPGDFLGQIELQEVPDFIGAPEEIRTPDPQIRSVEVCLSQASMVMYSP
jgi:hypothetical protein